MARKNFGFGTRNITKRQYFKKKMWQIEPAEFQNPKYWEKRKVPFCQEDQEL